MFRKILLWFGGMLLFSLAAYLATNIWLVPRSPFRDDRMLRQVTFESTEAARTYESGGREELKGFLGRLDRYLGPRHLLVDASGQDLVTGEDRSEMMRRAETRPRFRFPPPREILFKQATPDGRYALMIQVELPADPGANLAYYLWIVLVIVLLCYVLAWTLARPIRGLHEAVVRFGKGDLSSRITWSRKDEVGDLAQAFNQMADRIQTLLTAERRLLQDVSHELRSPLTRLRFALQLAQSRPDAESAFDRVNREVDRLSTLVGDLLQVTRAEGDPDSHDPVRIDLDELLQSIVDDCELEAGAKGCAIQLRKLEPVTCNGDRELLHRAVENVMRNAIRHTPGGSTIEVDLSNGDGRISLRVRDYGPGVPPDQLERIFHPFYRVEEDRSRDGGGGVGLGLAIAQRAIHLHHGEIRAVNMNPGLQIEIILPQ